jgi:fucose permease
MAIPSVCFAETGGVSSGAMYGFLLKALGAFIFVLRPYLPRRCHPFLIGSLSIGTGLASGGRQAKPRRVIIVPIEDAHSG